MKKQILMKRSNLQNAKFLYFTCIFIIIIALLIIVSIYGYLIKYRAKQKHLLPFNFTNNKLKEIISGIILETEGSIRKIQKRVFFQYKKVKKGTPNLTSPYVYSLFTLVFIKQIFEKKCVIKGSVRKLDSVLA